MNAALPVLERLLALSEDMVSVASGEDWASLAAHEAERQALTAHLPNDLSSSLPPTERTRASALIEKCLACDAKVTASVNTRLSELRILLREPLP